MMIAKITNVKQDYDYEVKDIVCINYVDTNIILMERHGHTFTYGSDEVVISILMEGKNEGLEQYETSRRVYNRKRCKRLLQEL